VSLSDDLDDVLNPLLAAFDAVLEEELTEELTDLYVSGADQMVKWGKGGTIVEAVDPGGRIVIPADYEGPPRAKAINWARKHGATLVTQMDDETKRRLAGVVSNGIKNKRGVDGIGRDIRKEIQQMSVYRGRMISRTETASALSQGSLDAMKDMGIEGKEWVTAGGPCDICSDNAAAGVIPVDQAFPSGDMAPPAHPNCECALAPARLPSEVTAEEPTVAQVRQDFEGRYRTAEIEHCVSTGPHGQILVEKSGSANRVQFTATEMDRMQGAKLFTHNHPDSIPFSDDDLRFAAKIKCQRMEVISPKYRYSVSPGKYGWGDPEALFDCHRYHMWDLHPKYQEIWYKTKDTTATSRLHFHEVMQLVAKDKGLKYTREAL